MSFIIQDTLGNPWSVVIDATTGALNSAPATGVTPSTNDNSISVVAQDLITSALRLCGVVAAGELATIDEYNDSLMVLNHMIDAWNADRLSIFSTPSADYALTIGKQSYTLGPGGDWNTNRPPKIIGISSILLSNPSNPIEEPIVMVSPYEWQTKIPVKIVNGSFPLICYDDGGMPLRTLNFWPIPSQQNNIRIYSWAGLATNSTLSSVLNFPQGYALALRYNLAVLLSAEFAAQLPQTVPAVATESLARLRTMNHPDLGMDSDLLPGPTGYSYKADMFGIPW